MKTKNNIFLQNFFIIICFIICLTIFISCSSKNNQTEYNHEIYIPLNINSNRIQHYCMINDKNYFDLCALADNGTINYISDNIPPGNKINTIINGITTDGQYLYCHARDMQINDSGKIMPYTGIYKIDIINNEINVLAEWDTPNYRHNYYSMQINGDYIYFFKDNDYKSNDICRVKINGTEYEQLTNNKGSIYTGIFFINDTVYYHKDINLYKTTINNLDNGELFFENLYAIELYNGYFYCISNTENTFLKIKADDPTSVNVLFNDIYNDCYIIKDDIIYYAKYDPVNVGKGLQGIDIINATQGCIYSYNIITEENKFYFQNNEMNFIKILNINETSILAGACTNHQLLTEDGLNVDYYIIPLNGSEAYHIKDLTLNLAGT